MTSPIRTRPDVWWPQAHLSTAIHSIEQLRRFNERGGIAVDIDVMRSVDPWVEISGSQSEHFSFWRTSSRSGFVTKPKFSADLVTIRFVVSGHFTYSGRRADILGSPAHATLVDFESIAEVRASDGVDAVSATIAVETLTAANHALTGRDDPGLPTFAPVADTTLPGMSALFHTVQRVRSWTRDQDRPVDLLYPLIREVMSYQLLSSWPKAVPARQPAGADVPSRRLGIAIDYIEENLSKTIALSDIAAAASISVRSLQDKFKKEIGRTPVQFIVDRRLECVHRDLIAGPKAAWPIARIARHWGFVHMSDFGQRYRRAYGCTPSETRRKSAPVR
ncbi:helix-turn-helix transcriptional regulator [Methylorubrum sp. SB2]|uniref:helix-turn-helix transcriptional regulator n=1 Tax=Methylorubrum subtropicum TaxID=3138812 RepID=UPI00313E1863